MSNDRLVTVFTAWRGAIIFGSEGQIRTADLLVMSQLR